MSDIDILREIDAIKDPGERLIAKLNYYRSTSVRARKLVINRAMLPDDMTDEQIALLSSRIQSGVQVPEEFLGAVKWV